MGKSQKHAVSGKQVAKRREHQDVIRAGERAHVLCSARVCVKTQRKIWKNHTRQWALWRKDSPGASYSVCAGVRPSHSTPRAAHTAGAACTGTAARSLAARSWHKQTPRLRACVIRSKGKGGGRGCRAAGGNSPGSWKFPYLARDSGYKVPMVFQISKCTRRMRLLSYICNLYIGKGNFKINASIR